MTATLSAPDAVAHKEVEINRIDCDVHPNFRHGLSDLEPYLSPAFRRRVGVGQGEDWAKNVAASHFSLPTNVMYINPAGAIRRDTASDGTTPASNPALVADQLLDQHGIDRAVLLCGNILGIGGLADPDLATAIANAYNEWLYENWLQADERFRGGLVVAPQDVNGAVATINRFASRPGFVQVHIAMNDQLLGERSLRPIYEAAQEHQMPIAAHPNSIDGIFRTGPQMAGGRRPTTPSGTRASRRSSRRT